MKIIKTHRCEESLKNKISINYCNPYKFIPNRDETGWWLRRTEQDFDYDVVLLKSICKIKYCPFCGKKLDENKEDTEDNK